MGAWVIGHNLAGYGPESDTFAYETWDDAAESYRIMVTDYADTDDDRSWDERFGELIDPDGDIPCMSATVAAIYSDGDGPRVGCPFTAYIEDSELRMVAFWLVWEPARMPDDLYA